MERPFLNNGVYGFAVQSIEGNVAKCLGLGYYDSWIEKIDGPGIKLNSGEVVPLGPACHFLTPEEMVSFKLEFIQW